MIRYIYTDGAHSSSSNYGGWAIVYTMGNLLNFHSGYEYDTTNNRMELTAVIAALQLLKARPSNAIIYTDSAYIANCISQRWYYKWQNNNWLTAKKTPVINKDLWEQLIDLYNYVNLGATVQIQKVSGHSGEKLNELADYYAVQARIQGAKEHEKQSKATENINTHSNSSREC